MLSHAQKLQLGTHDAVVLCRGMNIQGNPFWVFLQLDRQEIETLNEAYNKAQNIDLLNHGRLLCKGMGHDIPDDIMQHMQQHYGFIATASTSLTTPGG